MNSIPRTATRLPSLTSLFSLLSLTWILVPLALTTTGCHRHHEGRPPEAPPRPIAVAPPAPVSCGPIGVWVMAGPGAETEADVSQGETPDVFVVTERFRSDLGPGGRERMTFKINVGAATAGLASCAMSADCQSMSCGVAGQPPIVFRR